MSSVWSQPTGGRCEFQPSLRPGCSGRGVHRAGGGPRSPSLQRDSPLDLHHESRCLPGVVLFSSPAGGRGAASDPGGYVSVTFPSRFRHVSVSAVGVCSGASARSPLTWRENELDPREKRRFSAAGRVHGPTVPLPGGLRPGAAFPGKLLSGPVQTETFAGRPLGARCR